MIQVSVIARPRLHLTLIGMNRDGYRINGGLGFAIRDPAISITALAASDFEIVDRQQRKFGESDLARLQSTLAKICTDFQFSKKIKVEITGEVISHVGFGSSTAIRLSCIEALFILNSHQYTNELLVSLSGRGGTSGIGINTFFRGGFIFDLGRKSTDYVFRPSSLSENRIDLPLVLKSLEMPEWDIGICLPRNIHPKSEREEKEFFEKTCPIEDDQVNETLYHAVYGLVASIIEKDKKAFSDSIKKLQNCEWKKAERSLYGNVLAEIESRLYEHGAAAVGMSSLGPALFFVSDNVSAVISKMKAEDKGLYLIMTIPSNQGRGIKYG